MAAAIALCLMSWSTTAAATNTAPVPTAVGLEAAFRAANSALAEGRYAEGARQLDALPTNGRTSAALEYNRGLAHSRLGESGAARAHWMLAARLEPRNPAVLAALSRSPSGGASASGGDIGGPLSWTDLLTLNEWGTLAMVACWTWGLLLLIGRWRPSAASAVRGYATGCGVVAICLAGLFAGALLRRSLLPDAIALRPDTVVRVSPLDEARSAFTLAEGQRVRAKPGGGAWLLVEDPSTRRFGWAKADGFLQLPLR